MSLAFAEVRDQPLILLRLRCDGEPNRNFRFGCCDVLRWCCDSVAIHETKSASQNWVSKVAVVIATNQVWGALRACCGYLFYGSQIT
jgi:hypothetical protein